MLRFGLWVGGLSLVLAGLTVVVMLWGRAYPGPDEVQAAGFDVCDGRPCYMGNTPGVTSWDDTWTAFAPKEPSPIHNEFFFSVNDAEVDLKEDEKEATIGYLWIRDLSNQQNEVPSLAYFIDRYGTPCGVTVMNSSELNVFYPYMQFLIYGDNERIDLQLEAKDIEIVNSHVSYCAQRPENQGYGLAVIPWLGFASLDKYIAYATNHKL